MAKTENIFIKSESFYVSRHAYLKKREGMAIISPVENQNDLELDFKVFFFVDSCC